MKKYIPKVNYKYILKLTVLFAVYFFTARLGLHLFAIHQFATVIWPPTGIALAALILYGYDLWPAITIGAFLVNLLTGASPLIALGIAIGNTLEAVVGTYLLRQYIQIYRCFERLRDTLLFIGIVSLGAATISATVGVGSLLLGHVIVLADIPNTWLTWWIGDTLGALVVTPLLLVCIRPTRAWNNDGLGFFELMCGLIFLVGSNLLIFWYPMGPLQNSPLLYLILFPLIWAGIRFGSRGMTIAIFTTSVIAVFSTVYGHGPFVTIPLGSGLLFLEIFIGTLSITFLIFISIVKERKHSMEKLNEHVVEIEHALKKISSADKAKNDFLAILAHELRNPLAPVLSSLELLQMGVTENPETLGLVKIMETHVHTMAHLLDDILDISRIARKKFKLQKEVFSLQLIITQSIDIAKPKLSEKDHLLLINMPRETVWLFGDPLRIEQVVVNLLVNAAKYTHPKGRIVVGAKVEEDIVIISVKDNGMGIAANMIDKIFEPFLQANREDMRSDTGLGIGLALTRQLVELHNGHIVAKSEGRGMGSEFLVALPIPEKVQIPLDFAEPKIKNIEENTTPVAPKIEQKKYTILVVDDNIAAADGMRQLLQHKGHTVESVYDGMAVFQKLRSFPAEIIILDIGLPQMDGYEVAEKIRAEIGEEITLIALTGYGQESDKQKARDSGFDYHLTKPVSISDVEKIINEL